ncbi:kinase-like protein [Athelia psychrophila]|uniref:Kinase-like protein n=1 Tax=Athelia psychrophila TaxID=1759441 RepID=A0A166SHU9_9AGAM|nr:kinase-like protein [Fibularhizoctonia sp. CBS 109695]
MSVVQVSILNGKIRRTFDIASNVRGGFGDILTGEYDDGQTTRAVAIKLLRPRFKQDRPLTRDNGQRREIKLWKCLFHPNIVPLLGLTTDFGEPDSFRPNLPGMVSPWMRNGNLIAYVKGRDLDIAQLLKLLCDVATGLAYLHSSLIIHGDLTPANVLIDENHNACLTDFGLSTLTGGLEGTSYFTSTTGGAMRWRAPELVPDIDYVATMTFVPRLTTECDIYSYGQIVLQIISGELPYYNIKHSECIRLELFKRSRPNRPVPCDRLTDEYWALVNKCWGETPAARPSATEVLTHVNGLHHDALAGLV